MVFLKDAVRFWSSKRILQLEKGVIRHSNVVVGLFTVEVKMLFANYMQGKQHVSVFLCTSSTNLKLISGSLSA